MLNTRIRFEQVPGLATAGQKDSGMREPLFSGIEYDARDCDVGAQGHTRQHEHVPDFPDLELSKLADPPVSNQQFLRAKSRLHRRQRFGKQRRISVTESRLE